MVCDGTAESPPHTHLGAILPLYLLNDAVRTVISCREKVVVGPSLIRCRYWCLYLREITKEYMLSVSVLLVWVSEKACVLQHSCVIVDFILLHPELLDQSDLLLRHAWGRPQRNEKQINPDPKSLSPTELTRSSLERTPVLPHFLQTLPLLLLFDFLLLSLSIPGLCPAPPRSPSVSLGPSGLSGGVGYIGPCQGSSVGPCWRHKGRITAAASHTKTRTAAPRSLFQCP